MSSETTPLFSRHFSTQCCSEDGLVRPVKVTIGDNDQGKDVNQVIAPGFGMTLRRSVFRQSSWTFMCAIAFHTVHWLLAISVVCSPLLLHSLGSPPLATSTARSVANLDHLPLPSGDPPEGVPQRPMEASTTTPVGTNRNLWTLPGVPFCLKQSQRIAFVGAHLECHERDERGAVRDMGANATQRRRRRASTARRGLPPAALDAAGGEAPERAMTGGVSLRAMAAAWKDSPLYASPLMVVVWYTVYLVGSAVLLVLTRGELTGHFSVLRLAVGAVEVVWFVQHAAHAFALYIWLLFLSHWRGGGPGGAVPVTGVSILQHGRPYARVDTSGRVALYWSPAVGPSAGNSADVSPDVALGPADLSYYLRDPEDVLRPAAQVTGTIFLLVILWSLLRDTRRVLEALIGLRSLAEPEGCHRCPLCGALMEVVRPGRGDGGPAGRRRRPRSSSLSPAGTAPAASRTDAEADAEDTTEEETEEEDSAEENGCSTVHRRAEESRASAGGRLRRVHRHRSLGRSGYDGGLTRHVRHRCPRLLLDRTETTGSTVENSEGPEETSLPSESSGEDPAASRRRCPSPRRRAASRNVGGGGGGGGGGPPPPPNGRSRSTPWLLFSFASQADYGATWAASHPAGAANPRGREASQCLDDEFRPGNAFPSYGQAGWLSRLTYHWLNPLVGVARVDRAILRHTAFLPALPEHLLALDQIVNPAWALWVNRRAWYGSFLADSGTMAPDHPTRSPAEGPPRGEGVRGSDDERSRAEEEEEEDEEEEGGERGEEEGEGERGRAGYTVVVLGPKPLTRSKLRPQRPRRSRVEALVLGITSSVRHLLFRGLCRFFADDAPAEDEADESPRCFPSDTSSESAAGGSGGAPAGISRDVPLLYLFLAHRGGRRWVYGAGLLLLLHDLLAVAVVLLLGELLAVPGDDAAVSPGRWGRGWAALLLVFLLQCAVAQAAALLTAESALTATTAVQGCLLEKTLALPLAQRAWAEREVVHLIAVDAPRCGEGLRVLHQTWRALLLPVMAAGLVGVYLGGASAAAALGGTALALAQRRWEGRRRPASPTTTSNATATRVSLTRTCLGSMRQIKALRLEPALLQRLLAERGREEARAQAAVPRAAWRHAAAEVVVLLPLGLSLGVARGGDVTARALVPVLAALTLAWGPLRGLPRLHRTVAQARRSLDRIEGFLRHAADEFVGTWVDLTRFAEDDPDGALGGRGTVFCGGCSFTWQHDRVLGATAPVLREVRMHLLPGELTVVQGPSGAGKSTLLLAMLGEVNGCVSAWETSAAEATHRVSFPTPAAAAAAAAAAVATASIASTAGTGGSPSTRSEDRPTDPRQGFLVFGSYAYCSEEPWIKSDTLRANVTMSGNPTQRRWYRQVLWACGLLPDLEILPHGEETLLGDGGVVLSRSQEVRVALARAVFSRADIYILDGVLTPLEEDTRAHVIREVLHNLLGHKTVILASSGELAALRPHRIFTVLMGGVVREDTAQFTVVDAAPAEEGGEGEAARVPNHPPPSLLRNLPTLYAEDFAEVAPAPCDGPAMERTPPPPWPAETTTTTTTHTTTTTTTKTAAVVDGWPVSAPPSPPPSSSPRASLLLGEPRGRWWWRWWWRGGWWVAAHVGQQGLRLVLLLGVIGIAAGSPAAAPGYRRSLGLLLVLLGGGAAGAAAGRTYAAATTTRLALHAAWEAAVTRLFRAPVVFFTARRVARLAQVLRRDVAVVERGRGVELDEGLGAVAQVAMGWLVCLGICPGRLAPVVLLLLLLPVMYGVTAGLLPVAGEAQRLERRLWHRTVALARETVRGAAVVRSLALQDRVREEFAGGLDAANTARWLVDMAEGWWLLRLQAMALLFTVGVAWVGGPAGTPAWGALALLIAGRSAEGCRAWGGCVRAGAALWSSERRLLRLQHVPVEPWTTAPEMGPEMGLEMGPEMGPETAPPLALVHLSARSRRTARPVLRGVHLVVGARERVGLTDRRGDGRYAIFNVLLRLVDEITAGTVRLEGREAGTMPYPLLRARFAVLPPDPLVLVDSWRYNLCLDAPHPLPPTLTPGEAPPATITTTTTATEAEAEAALWAALQAVGLAEAAEQSGGLDALLRVDGHVGAELAAGVRQRLCLARAILRPAPIVLLDLSMQVDAETEAVVGRVLAESLADRTVLLATQRVSALHALCTRVVTLADGAVVSDGRPMAPPLSGRGAEEAA